MSVSFLILSDIHFGKFAAVADFAVAGTTLGHQVKNAVPMREALVKQARECNPGFILVPGDITSIAAPAEFTGGIEFVREVAEACAIAESDIFYTFGNHDANWRISRLCGADSGCPEDQGYSKIASEVGTFFVSNLQIDVVGPLPGSGLFQRADYDLLVLNTGYYCTHEQEFRHGKLGIEQLTWARNVLTTWNATDRWKIVMLHHHPFNYAYPTPGPDISTLEEGAELLDALGRAGVHIVCHGHRHHPRLSTRTDTSWAHPVTFFCAGSVAVTEHDRNNGDIPNLFHSVTLDTKDTSGTAIGRIDTFKYTAGDGWIRSRRSSAVPLDSPQVFGSCATAQQRRSDAETCIDALVAASLPAQLPSHDELPISLRCLPGEELKALLVEVANARGCMIYGDYPSGILLVTKTP